MRTRSNTVHIFHPPFSVHIGVLVTQALEFITIRHGLAKSFSVLKDPIWNHCSNWLSDEVFCANKKGINKSLCLVLSGSSFCTKAYVMCCLGPHFVPTFGFAIPFVVPQHDADTLTTALVSEWLSSTLVIF